MRIIERAFATVRILELDGRFDAYEVPAVREWLLRHAATPSARMVINLGGVTFIDSTALATLVHGLKRCREYGGELVLTDLPQSVRIIFELTRMDRAFTIFPSEVEAVASLTRERNGHG